MGRYIYEGRDANGDSISRFQFAEVVIDCHLLFPLLDENTSVAEKNLARFLLATTVSTIPIPRYSFALPNMCANQSSWRMKWQ